MIIIEVKGRPAPQGSKRVFPNGGMVESSKAVGPWREAVRAQTQATMTARAAAGWCDADGNAGYGRGVPVEVSILFLLARPRGHYGSGRNASTIRPAAPLRPATVPDQDKLARAVLDGITAGGAIANDSQVADSRVSKAYCLPGETPGCLIRVELAAASPVVGRELFDDVARLLAGAS